MREGRRKPGRKMEMPSIVPAEAAYNRLNTSCSNSNGRCNGDDPDISSSAAPTKTTNASPAALPTSQVEPPAGVRARAIRRIENTISRQVTFCKRRTRLFKKAHELAVFGDAQVAVIAFSSKGKMHQYASSSMSHILERYRDWRSSLYQVPPPVNPADLSLQDGVEFWRREAFFLQQHIKHLTDLHSNRYLMGENLSFLPLSDIKMIESTLEAAVHKTRLRKMELLQLQDQTTSQKLAEVAAISHGPNKSSTTIGMACARPNFASHAQLMTNFQAAHTSDDADCGTVMLELGL